jgi:hypothetical protein
MAGGFAWRWLFAGKKREDMQEYQEVLHDLQDSRERSWEAREKTRVNTELAADLIEKNAEEEKSEEEKAEETTTEKPQPKRQENEDAKAQSETSAEPISREEETNASKIEEPKWRSQRQKRLW